MVSRLQGSYITKHEGKSKVRDADSHFLFPGICSDYIFINLDRCMSLLLFTGKLVPYGLFFSFSYKMVAVARFSFNMTRSIETKDFRRELVGGNVL